MFTEWSITNFKSAYDATTLALKPVTVFAGANSAGKSTTIQSMLLVAQTINNRVFGRPVILNGHMTRLGTFDDLCSFGALEKRITIGFAYESLEPESPPPFFGPTPRYRAYPAPESERISCQFSFIPDPNASTAELRQLQPALDRCELTIKHDEASDTTVRIRKSTETTGDRARSLDIDPSSLSSSLRDSLQYEIISSKNLSRVARRYGLQIPEGKIVGVELHHFVPWRFSMVFDATEDEARRAVRLLAGLERRPDLKLGHFRDYYTAPLLSDLKSIASESAEKADLQEPRAKRAKKLLEETNEQDLTAENVNKLCLLLHSNEFRARLGAHLDDLIRQARGRRPARPTLAWIPVLHDVESTVSYAFTNVFRYLGPLRDEPKSVYPLAGAIDPNDVGLRGEFTAAALDINKNRRIFYVPPPGEVAKGKKRLPKEEKLLQAVLAWLRHFGLVERIETKDRGVLGHELTVALQREGAFHNLVHVGVGVSQVLPILVMALLADPGTTLVLEQPELHLHPKVQTLLGDFVLSLAAVEKQCIIETHSEYLVNRLRLRVAEDSTDSVQDKIQLYFVEKSGMKTLYRDIALNKYGALDEWPSGFFDQTPAEADRIIQAAMQKRRQQG